MKSALKPIGALAVSLAFIQIACANILVTGSTSDKTLFASTINNLSAGGTWTIDGSNELSFSALPQNSFAFYLYSFDQQPGLTVTLAVGQNQPGVIVGRFNGNAVQDIDLGDISVFPTTDPNLFTKGSILIHEVSEVFFANLRGLAFPAAHQQAISYENSYLRSTFSAIQRIPTGDQIIGDCTLGACTLRIPTTWLGTSAYIDIGLVGDAVISPGFANLGGGSGYNPGYNISVLSQTLVPIPEPTNRMLLALGLFALVVRNANKHRIPRNRRADA